MCRRKFINKFCFFKGSRKFCQLIKAGYHVVNSIYNKACHQKYYEFCSLISFLVRTVDVKLKIIEKPDSMFIVDSDFVIK